MKKQYNDPRGGLLIALGVLLAALWGLISYGAYEESKRVKYDVSVRPGAVTYGTHSTAFVSSVSASTYRSSVPMISGGAVRSYAHYGHASMPKASTGSGYRLHTTSSATVHSIGGGGSTGGGGYSAGGNSSSSNRINCSVSMPTLAMATPSRTTSSISGSVTSGITTSASSLTQGTTTSETSSSVSPARRGSIRKGQPSGEGGEGEWRNGGEGDGDWWYYDPWDGWVAAEIGDTRPAGDGNYYRYDGEGPWTLVNDQGDPVNPTPLGDTPWFWMIIFAAIYAINHAKRQKRLA